MKFSKTNIQMKKVFAVSLSFILGAYIALSIANVFAFTNPSQNPPNGNITPNFSGLSIQDQTTFTQNGDITTIAGPSTLRFNKPVGFDGAVEMGTVNISTIKDNNELDVINFNSNINLRDSVILNTGGTNNGNVVINDKLDVKDTIQNSVGDLTIADNLRITGTSALVGASTFTGNATFNGASTFTGSVNMGTLSLSTITDNNDLNAVDFNTGIDLKNGAIFNSSNTNGGSVKINDTLNVTQTATFKGIDTSGPIVNTQPQVAPRDDSVWIGDKFTVEQTSNFKGAIANSGGNLTVSDKLDVTDTIQNPNADLTIADNLRITGTSTLVGASTFNNNLTVINGFASITGTSDAAGGAADSGILRINNTGAANSMRLDDDEIVTRATSLFLNQGTANRVVIGDTALEPGLKVWGDTHIQGDDTVNLVGGTNLGKGLLSISNDDATRGLALDAIHIISHGGPLFLNSNDGGEDVVIGGLNTAVDLTVNGAITATSNIGRFYSRLGAQTNVAPDDFGTASAVCDAGDFHVSCGYATQQSLWVVPNGSWADANDNRTCYAKMTNRSSSLTRWIKAISYCFSPNG